MNIFFHCFCYQFCFWSRRALEILRFLSFQKRSLPAVDYFQKFRLAASAAVASSSTQYETIRVSLPIQKEKKKMPFRNVAQQNLSWFGPLLENRSYLLKTSTRAHSMLSVVEFNFCIKEKDAKKKKRKKNLK